MYQKHTAMSPSQGVSGPLVTPLNPCCTYGLLGFNTEEQSRGKGLDIDEAARTLVLAVGLHRVVAQREHHPGPNVAHDKD